MIALVETEAKQKQKSQCLSCVVDGLTVLMLVLVLISDCENGGGGCRPGRGFDLLNGNLSVGHCVLCCNSFFFPPRPPFLLVRVCVGAGVGGDRFRPISVPTSPAGVGLVQLDLPCSACFFLFFLHFAACLCVKCEVAGGRGVLCPLLLAMFGLGPFPSFPSVPSITRPALTPRRFLPPLLASPEVSFHRRSFFTGREMHACPERDRLRSGTWEGGAVYFVRTSCLAS